MDAVAIELTQAFRHEAATIIERCWHYLSIVRRATRPGDEANGRRLTTENRETALNAIEQVEAELRRIEWKLRNLEPGVGKPRRQIA